MSRESIDWQALERLRAAYLEGSAGKQDYWQSERDLLSYDQTFAQRIGWKWDYVLNELTRRRWVPPRGTVLDWGCGTGVAGRAYLGHFGTEGVEKLLLWDRSAAAVRFAQRRAGERFPGLAVQPLTAPSEAEADLLLVSHVLTELDEDQLSELVATIEKAGAVIWVEPGTREVSRRLSQVRETLKRTFQVVAPCVHQNTCGMLAAENASHWCHHFASPPAAIFTDPNWSRFANMTGIDLRSLPLSFLVLDKRPVLNSAPGAVRVIGRARVYKAHALLLGCDAGGLQERRLTKRLLPAQFRELKKDRAAPLQVWTCEEDEITRAENMVEGPAPGAQPSSP